MSWLEGSWLEGSWREERRAAVRLGLLAPLLVAVLTLAGCGFRPLYATAEGGAADELATIEVGRIPDRVGQQLRTRLELLLDPRGSGGVRRYGLQIQLRVDSSDVAIRRDETASRRDLAMSAGYVLTDLPAGQVLTPGLSRAVNRYRPEERRAGQDGVSTSKTRGSPSQ